MKRPGTASARSEMPIPSLSFFVSFLFAREGMNLRPRRVVTHSHKRHEFGRSVRPSRGLMTASDQFTDTKKKKNTEEGEGVGWGTGVKPTKCGSGNLIKKS